MTTLHLGVNDIPYSEESSTTGDVAEILEAKYGIMRAFYSRHGSDVANGVENALAGQVENMMMGAPISGNPFAGAESCIQAEFRKFLESGEIETMGIAGVPTKASIQRRSLRFKSKKAKGARPSFIDSGTYDASFMAWID